MTKKPSIFKILGEYFKSHPLAVAAWIWVTVLPLLGSLVLASQHQQIEEISLETISDQVVFTFSLAVILGTALLPTTLSALAIGFFWGWKGFFSLLAGYFFANILGYLLGKKINADFLPLLYQHHPQLQQEIEGRSRRHGSLVFFVRISPVIPFALSNFIFASMKIPLRKVLLFGVPGMLPRTFIAFSTGMIANSFLGAQDAIQQPIQWLILVGFLVLSLGGIYWSWKKNKA